MTAGPDAGSEVGRDGDVAASSRTLDRGLRVLEVLAGPDAGAGLSVTELATAVGVGRPAVYRLVATLEEHRLVSRDGARIRLGAGLVRLGAAAAPVVRAGVEPVLRRLAEATGATAHLTVVEGERAVALVVVEPTWTDLHVAYRSGTRHPLDQGAAGRAILAGRRGRLGPVRSDGELQSGAHGVAVPVVRDEADRAEVLGSVGVVSLQPLDPGVDALLVAAAADLVPVLR